MSAFRNQLMERLQSRRFYVTVIISLLIIIWLQSVYFEWRNGNALRICVVNGGTYYIGSAVPVMVDDETNRETARDVAASVFDRLPTGMMFPEKLERIVNTEVRKEVISQFEKDKNEFQAQEATQTFELTQKIVEQRINDSTVKMLLQGDVVKNSKIRGVTQPATSASVRVTMLLVRNDDWRFNHMFPKVCSYLKVEYPQ